MKLYGYTTSYNVAYLIPYVMPYVERVGYDKFIVYDNESTDNTVELLKQYPFVEIRTYSTNKKFSDYTICDIHLNAFCELVQEIEKTGEEIWMTWTDFDEVIFLSYFYSLKEYAHNMREIYGYNYFAGKMVDLFFKDFKTVIPAKHELVHTLPNILCHYWEREGTKPSLLCINDVDYMTVSEGNHVMYIKPVEGKKFFNMDDICQISAFHLKYLDKNYIEKIIKTRENEINGCWEQKNNNIEDYLSACFPISLYFALKNTNIKEKLYQEGIVTYE